MNFRRVGILCNPNSGCGKDRVFELTQQAFECLHPQVPEIMVGPGYLGEVVCTGRNVTVIGQNSSGSRIDTIETTKQMVQKGVELFVIVSGDGTYNDAVEGMKSVGVTLPIFGIAAGRFNAICPKRKLNPFVSMRGDFRPFSVDDLVVEDVMGIVSRVNDEVVSYGFFWAVVCNSLAYTDEQGSFMTIDAAQYINGKIIPVKELQPVATEATRVVLLSNKVGEVELASGPNIAMPIVSPLVDEINYVVAGGFGMFAKIMGFHGVAYCFTNPKIEFMPNQDLFPIETKSVAFYEGDKIRCTGLRNGSVFQVDSTAICRVAFKDVLIMEIVLKLGKKAQLKPFRYGDQGR
jgi:hypothetical protein